MYFRGPASGRVRHEIGNVSGYGLIPERIEWDILQESTVWDILAANNKTRFIGHLHMAQSEEMPNLMSGFDAQDIILCVVLPILS